jgi:hypothetical protein
VVIQAVGILLLIVGVVLELFGVGSEQSLGTLTAVCGIGVFVFGLLRKGPS